MKKLSLLCKSAILVIALLAITINPVLVKAPPTPTVPEVDHVWSWSTGDSTGIEKNTFLPSDDVYCKIKISKGDVPIKVTIYIVYNNEWNKTGPTPPQLIDRSGGNETVILTPDSQHATDHFVKIWSGPLTPGEYDIVVDENLNGVRDPGEAVDLSSVDVGFFVVPELPLGTLMAIMASMAAIGLTKNRPKAKQ
jgi:hypothetical protein